jgi:hypothetical protein
MCDPISIAGAALSGAGMAANSIAANQVASATNAAEQQTAMLNQVDANRAFAANRQALGNYNNFAAGQGAMGQQLGDYLKTAVKRAPPPSQMAPTGGSTSAAVAAGAPSVSSFSNQQAGALGNLNSFGDYLAQQNRAANRGFKQANMNDEFMRQNNAVLGLQLNDASHATQSLASSRNAPRSSNVAGRIDSDAAFDERGASSRGAVAISRCSSCRQPGAEPSSRFRGLPWRPRRTWGRRRTSYR